MSEFRMFSGKSVDDAMEEACRQFGVAREKLEIEILTGGSSGIFGIVGKKKAKVRARVREEINLREMDEPAPEEPATASNRSRRSSRSGRPSRPPRQPKPAPAPEAAAPEAPVPSPEPEREPVSAVAPQETPDPAPTPDPTPTPTPQPDPAPEAAQPRQEAPAEKTPPTPLSQELSDLIREIMEQMLDGILGQVPEFEISGTGERVSVLVQDEENSGLLIGREGQTLSSIQYLVNRMVARRYGSPVKVQINTGEYRERQDDNLRKMAVFLADKAKSLGRPQSTKPLSSYHRRVVHLALQEDAMVSTRSKGEGPLKRVLIVPRTAKGDTPPDGQR